MLKSHEEHGHELFHTPFYRRLRSVIEWCLHHRKTVLAGTLLAFILGGMGMGLTEKQFFPSSNRTELMIDILLPEGSDIRATEREAARVEALLSRE